MRAILVEAFGGPEVLRLAEVPEPVAGDGQVTVTVSRAGVNYADTHQAENSYLQPTRLPFVPGVEAAGTTPDGRRVVAVVDGGYAERAVAQQAHVFELPAQVGDGEALALLVQGTTAWHLLRTCAHLGAGESVVVHAAAGGVGTLAVQLARRFGAGRVIATASSDHKRRLALELGADAAVDPAEEDLRAALRAANGGAGVDVVLEMTGGRVFDQNLAALAPFGRLVVYGMAGREPPSPLEPGRLMRRSSAVIGFWLAHCLTRPWLLRQAMDELLVLTAAGELRPVVGGTYPLGQAGRAHEDLRARRTIGKLLLDPSG